MVCHLSMAHAYWVAVKNPLHITDSAKKNPPPPKKKITTHSTHWAFCHLLRKENGVVPLEHACAARGGALLFNLLSVMVLCIYTIQPSGPIASSPHLSTRTRAHINVLCEPEMGGGDVGPGKITRGGEHAYTKRRRSNEY